MGSPIHFPPDYDDMPAFDYDTTYMAEINNRMKVPYKLGPTGEAKPSFGPQILQQEL